MDQKTVQISEIVVLKSLDHSFPAEVMSVTDSYMIVKPLSYIDANYNPGKTLKINWNVVDLIRPNGMSTHWTQGTTFQVEVTAKQLPMDRGTSSPVTRS